MHTDRDLLGMFNNLAVNRFSLHGQWHSRSRWQAAHNNHRATQTPAIVQPSTQPAVTPDTSKVTVDPQAAVYKPTAGKPSVTYTKPTTTPVAQDPSETADTPATANTESTTTPATTSRQSWYSYVRLDMQFNLSQFEQTVSQLADDAADGEISEQTLSRLRLGLHTELAAKGVTYSETAIDSSDSQAGVNSMAKADVQTSRALQSMSKAREYQAGMFYKDSLKSKFSEKQVTSDGFLRTSRKLAMRYTQDFTFKFRSLQQFNRQASALGQTGNADQYINTTEALVDNPDVSGGLIGQFFDGVQGYLDNMESDLIDKVNGFFDKMAQQLGIGADQIGSTREMLIGGIESFFNAVDSAVNSVAGKYISQPEPVATSEPVDNTETVTLEDTTDTAAA
jgi:hypothetical protein